MNTPANHWLAPATGASTTRLDAVRALRYRAALVARCAKQWPLLLALLTLAGLLLAFQRVVHEGVRQGDLRRLAWAARADDLSRCNVISSRARRESCHALLDSGQASPAQVVPEKPPAR